MSHHCQTDAQAARNTQLKWAVERERINKALQILPPLLGNSLKLLTNQKPYSKVTGLYGVTNLNKIHTDLCLICTPTQIPPISYIG